MGPRMSRPCQWERRSPKSGQLSSSALASSMRTKASKEMNASSSYSTPGTMWKRDRKGCGSAPSSRTRSPYPHRLVARIRLAIRSTPMCREMTKVCRKLSRPATAPSTILFLQRPANTAGKKPEEAMNAHHFDVLIIGAGLSGIGTACQVTAEHPNKTIAVLERRERLGGTWDLFRYPGIRSDSDIYTLCFRWEPWTRPEMIADGDQIWDYMADTARKHGIDQHIRFNTYVRSADWDSATDMWTVQTEHDGEPKTYRTRFLFFGSGYYNYDEPYTPTFPGIEDFKGEVVHPQHWPDDFDYARKRLVVIGSGATAVSMIPSLTDKAAHVTMLQRTPSYLTSAPSIDPTAIAVRRVLPLRVAHWLIRWRNAFFGGLVWFIARKTPRFGKRLLRRVAERNLPQGYDIDTH